MQSSPPRYDDPTVAPVPILGGSVPNPPDTTPLHLRQHRRFLGGSVFLLGAMAGFHDILLMDRGTSYGFLLLSLYATAAGFCVVDAQIRRQPIVFLSRWLLILAGPIAVPAYLILSDRKKGILRIIAFVGIFFTGVIIGAIAGMQLPPPLQKP